MPQTSITPELSRPVCIEDLGLRAFTMDIVPTADELQALAARLKIDSLNALSAHATLNLHKNGDVHLQGVVDARITQTCVITLGPVTNDIHIDFTTLYTPKLEDAPDNEEEEFTDFEGEDDLPEPIQDGKIDVGEAICEQLALEIDPFPRVKGATFDGYATGPDALDGAISHKKNPFAVLSQLKETPKSSK